MRSESLDFSAAARANLQKPALQQSLARIPIKFVRGRADAAEAYGDFEALRDAGEAIRNTVLANLGYWLTEFERAAQARGVQ
ncbi:MAG: (Fe-S)-binding protein, partial [Paucibacter sp.]|nr:(Fe-S)-binding protein [Roseateles sp.]